MASGFDGINLNRLVVFAAVVETASITQAAARLGLGKTVVSTHIRELERELGVTLLLRSTRRVGLTEYGRQFYDSVRGILRDARSAIESLSQESGSPRGALRISAPLDFSAYVLAPALVEIREAYPELKIELINDDRCIDLIGDKVDVAIRLSELADSDLQSVRIGSFTLVLVASPDFLARLPAISHPAEIEQWPQIAFSVFTPFSLNLFQPGEPTARIRFRPGFMVNTAFMAKALALCGGGFAVVPDFAAREDLEAGRLVQVLAEWSAQSKGIHVVFPRSRYIPRKVRVLIDHLKGMSEDRPRKAPALPQSS